jgi:dihydroorotase
MNMDDTTTILKNAHVIDPAQGIDRVTDVAIAGGKIDAVGDGMARDGATTIDLAGHYLSPGWVDLHVHAYGTLGFVDPDSIGIRQGVTSFVDAGGPGIRTLDECVALGEDGLLTSLYAGPHIFPMGIIGLDHVETDDDVRGIREVSTREWLDWMAAHPGVLRYLKVGAYSPGGQEPIALAREVANDIGLPLYLHIGENHPWPKLKSPNDDAFAVMGEGDIVTHVYHGCVKGQILGRDGRILPSVRAAADRGVLFDIGFGSYGFAWDVAEKALAQGLKPHFISSDLQQFNVLAPTFSLANVMSICLRLGLSLGEVIDGVTASPARALSLADRAGTLKPGMPADITIFKLESGSFELLDCVEKTRRAHTRFAPVMAFKAGRRVECDVALAQDEGNWFMRVVEDQVPEAARRLSPRQLEFLGALSTALATTPWPVYPPRDLSVRKALAVQDIFNKVRTAHGLAMREGVSAVYDCFMESRFPMQLGLFLVRLEHGFAIARLKEVTGRRAMAAA